MIYSYLLRYNYGYKHGCYLDIALGEREGANHKIGVIFYYQKMFSSSFEITYLTHAVMKAYFIFYLKY